MRLLKSITLVILSLFILNIVYAVGFGVSPATLSFEILKGGSAEKTITVSTSSEKLLPVSLSIEGLEKWISFTPNTNLFTSKSSPLKITIKVAVPKDAKAGKYEGAITATTAPAVSAKSGSGSSVATGVAVKTAINVTAPVSLSLGGMVLLVMFIVFAITGVLIVKSRAKRGKKR